MQAQLARLQAIIDDDEKSEAAYGGLDVARDVSRRLSSSDKAEGLPDKERPRDRRSAKGGDDEATDGRLRLRFLIAQGLD